MKPFVLSVKVLLHREDGLCLLLRRSQSSKNHAGKWDLPGGKVDAGESFDAAIHREVFEETGLRVELQHVLGASEAQLNDRVVVYLFLAASTAADDLRLSEEHDQFRWVPRESLCAQDLAPRLQKFFEKR